MRACEDDACGGATRFPFAPLAEQGRSYCLLLSRVLLRVLRVLVLLAARADCITQPWARSGGSAAAGGVTCQTLPLQEPPFQPLAPLKVIR